MSKTRLVVFSDDWGRHPSSCQHLIRNLLGDYEVYWVNSIGTRRPGLDWYSVRRGFAKLRSWMVTGVSSSVKAPGEPTVLQPLMWPSYRSRLGRQFNCWSLDKAVRLQLCQPGNAIGVTTLPIVADLVGRLPVDSWVYYCVDDLSRWPGLDKVSLELMERELVERVDEVIAVSDYLVRRMKSLGRSSHLLTHGVDPEFWLEPRGEAPAFLQGLAHPLVVFWGVIDQRLDVEWLKALNGLLKTGTVVLVGPENNPPREIRDLGRVYMSGALGLEALPWVAAMANVLIMPYAISPATRAMQPLKLKEYLATGKPVVSSCIPAVEEWRDACDVESSPEAFAAKVVHRTRSGTPSEQAEARRRIDSESWSTKAETFKRLVGDCGEGV